MVTLTFPYNFLSLALGGVALVCIYCGVGYFFQRSLKGANDVRGRLPDPVILLVLTSCAAALTGVMITATGTIDTSTLKHPYVSNHCELSAQTYLLGVVHGEHGDIDPKKGDFQIRRESIFMAGLNKITEYHAYFERLIGLAAIAVGVVIVTSARFLYAADRQGLHSALPRAAAALGFATSSFVALVASYHLLFLIINGQLSLLGSGYAYCYANFSLVYRDLFWMILFSGASAIAGLLVLPEALRFTYDNLGGTSHAQ